MSRTYQYRTSDVFTSTPYKGNQLGIVTILATSPLTQTEKQAIANEFNYSETIFVHEPSPAETSSSPSSSPPHITVDIFTTDTELPFAGHPTIGAIHHILTHIYPDQPSVIVDLKAGPVVGTLDRTTGFASAQIPQEFHRHRSPVRWTDVLTSQPSLKDGNEAGNGNGSGVESSTHALVSIVRGMNFGLVDLSADPGMLRKLRVTNFEVARGGDLDQGWPDTLVGSLFYVRRGEEQGDGVIRVDQRVMVIGLEDPATGSASCALTAYLALERGGQGAVHRFELVQGEQMGRKSVIGVEVTLDGSGGKIEKIIMSGQCKGVMKGELEI